MTLAARLDAIRQSFSARAPEEAKTVMARSADALRESGILETVPRAGAKAPSFALKDSRGNEVSLDGATRSGPVVLTFFRGHW